MAAEQQQAGPGGGGRLLPGSERHRLQKRIQYERGGENFTLTKDNMPKLKDQLQQKLREMNDFEKLKSHVEMTVTAEGLRIELMESVSGTFFESGSPQLNTDGRDLLISLAQELGKLPNKISIEGHTDSKPYAITGNYGNWELSSDCANAARRMMQANGVGPAQVTQVRGFADQRLGKTDDPLDPSNRRVSLIVQYVEKPAGEEPSTGATEGKDKNTEHTSSPSEGQTEKK
jgi:chemotaxis protein MotB